MRDNSETNPNQHVSRDFILKDDFNYSAQANAAQTRDQML